jgi:hypothetical protein
MARFKLKKGTSERDFGRAIVSAAMAQLTSGGATVAAATAPIEDLIEKQPNETFRFHYDGKKGDKYVIHIVVPDVKEYLKGRRLDLRRFAHEALADYLERGCAR